MSEKQKAWEGFVEILFNSKMFKPASGKSLDTHASFQGLKRKKYFWFFKEPDWLLRKRLLRRFKAMDYEKTMLQLKLNKFKTRRS